jgi:spore maturation protein CgeB
LKLAVQEGSKCLLTTGIAPLNAECLQKMGERKIWKSNFLTDDPWNPALYAPWFLEALPHYDVVYSPRKANMDQLRGLGCRSVEYLPFAYSRHIHFEVDPQYRESAPLSDVVFAGGADRDRLPWISALLRKGLSVALYGGYWERYPETRSSARGNADPATLRGAIAGASVALCLVRKANRDGHAMRTFEVPAMKAAMVVERTADHMDLFGVEGNAVCYFDSVPEMIEKVVWLLERPAERFRLAESAHRLIVNGGHTYHDRLQTMLSRVGETVVA